MTTVNSTTQNFWRVLPFSFSEFWTVRNKEERLLLTTEMRMLRCIMGVTLLDRETNENIRNELSIEPITDVVRRSRMRWFGHLLRMDDKNKVKEMWKMSVPGKRRQGRPKMRWLDNIRKDMLEMGLKMEDAQNREFWRKKIHAPRPSNQAGTGRR